MNIVDYVKNNLKTFEEEPLQPIDSLVFAWISYIQWDESIEDIRSWKGMTLQSLLQAEYFTEMFMHTYDPKLTQELFMYMAASPRFRNCILRKYVENFDANIEKQFAAITITYLPNHNYVSYRGTDSTFVGWKEDFNMAFTYPVPAQIDATNYLHSVYKKLGGNLYVGGHSKGGNLAMAAAAENTKAYDRIQQVYSFDGPGFLEEVTQDSAFQKITAKTTKLVPQSSYIGMLMDTQNNYNVVKSDSVSFWQHNPFTWKVENNDFVYLDELNRSTHKQNKQLNDWLKTISIDQRERFIDTLYSLTQNVEASTIAEFNDNWKVNYPKIIEAIRQLDPETRKFILDIIGDFATYPLRDKNSE